MAVTAFFSVLAFVNIDFLVAAVTIPRCFGMFFLGFVAGVAAGFRMHALQAEICFIMIESHWVQQYDVRIAAFMVFVAMTAFGPYRCRQASVKTFLVSHVIKYIFMIMALHA